MNRFVSCLVMFLVIGPMLLGCGPAVADVPRPTVSDSAFPTGDYMVLDGLGYWQFSFRSDGSYQVLLNDGLVIVERGEYVVIGDEITLTDQSRFCIAQSTGVYHWAFEQELLNVSLVKDSCLYWRYALTKGLVPVNSATLARKLPEGTYHKRLDSKLAPGLAIGMSEDWTLTFAADGRFVLAKHGKIIQEGQAMVVKDRVWFKFADANPAPCAIEDEARFYGAIQSAVYDWQSKSNGLLLAAMLDGCAERRVVLSRDVWLK